MQRKQGHDFLGEDYIGKFIKVKIDDPKQTM